MDYPNRDIMSQRSFSGALYTWGTTGGTTLNNLSYFWYFDWLFAILLCFDWLIYLFGAYYWGRATASNRMHSLFNFRYFHWLFAILLYVTSNQNYYLSSEKVKKYHTTPQKSYQKNKNQYTKQIQKTKVKKNTTIAKKMPQKSKKIPPESKNTTKVKNYHNNATILKIYHKLKKYCLKTPE